MYTIGLQVSSAIGKGALDTFFVYGSGESPQWSFGGNVVFVQHSKSFVINSEVPFFLNLAY